MALKSAVAARRNNHAQLWLWSLTESKSDFYVGIHPTKHCLARLRWAEHDNLPNLLSAVHSGICPRELYEFAVADHPRFLAELRDSVANAAQWELKRYSCLLIPRTIQNHNTKRLGD
jgi:hypothetical protein